MANPKRRSVRRAKNFLDLHFTGIGPKKCVILPVFLQIFVRKNVLNLNLTEIFLNLVLEMPEKMFSLFLSTFGPKMVSNFRTQYKSIQNLQTLQGYIFRILQHFANKLCNCTHSGP
jgi:hypothetical protein